MKNNFLKFLDTESKEKYYFLGFVAADGCIHKDSLIITLHKKDRHVLETFCVWLGLPLTTVKEKGEYVELRKYKVGLSEVFHSYAITERKSLTLKFPSINELYVKDFILGYFDGDGSCYTSKSQNKLYFNITGTEDVVREIKEISNSNIGYNFGIIQQYKNIFRFIVNGTKTSIDFGNWLYLNTENLPHLKRKEQKFLDFKLSKQSYLDTKLTIFKAREIREKRELYGLSHSNIAKEYNVSRQLVGQVLNNQIYRERLI